MDTRLQYLGKKSPLKLDMTTLRRSYVFGGEPVEVDRNDAKWLVATNPKMFREVTGEFKPEVSQEPRPVEKHEFVCQKCGKDFAIEQFYKDHVEECEVPDWEEVEGSFKCNLCDHEPYTEYRWFAQHMDKKHNIVVPEETNEEPVE